MKSCYIIGYYREKLSDQLRAQTLTGPRLSDIPSMMDAQGNRKVCAARYNLSSCMFYLGKCDSGITNSASLQSLIQSLLTPTLLM